MRRLLPILLVLVAPCPACGSDYPARVVGISDGDTITVHNDRTQIRIRLHGIDAPETGQDFGSRAKQAASGLAFGKQVTIRARDTDRYGRTVADVILPDGRSLNREMVREGLALAMVNASVPTDEPKYTAELTESADDAPRLITRSSLGRASIAGGGGQGDETVELSYVHPAWKRSFSCFSIQQEWDAGRIDARLIHFDG